MPSDLVTKRSPDNGYRRHVDIDASLTTVLQQAVLLGKADWVGKLLNMGGDPLEAGIGGRTALDDAEEMVSNHPEQKMRREILETIQTSIKKVSRKNKSPEVANLIGRLEEVLERLLSSELASFKDLTLSVVREAITVARNEVANAVTAVNTTRDVVETMKNEQASVVSSVKNLQLTIAEAREEIASLVSRVNSSLEDIKDGINPIKQMSSTMHPIGNNKGDINSPTHSHGDNRSEAAAKEDPEAGIPNPQPTVNENAGETIPTEPSQITKKIYDKEYYIEEMMRKTVIMPSSEEAKSKTKNAYEKFYDKDSIFSIIIRFLTFQRVSVHVYVGNEGRLALGRMISRVTDYDGTERKGPDFGAMADFETRKAYFVITTHKSYHSFRLAFSLTPLAIFSVFKNKGLPYRQGGDGGRDVEFKGILDTALRITGNGFESGKPLENYIELWVRNKVTQAGKEIYLSALVPCVIAQEGTSNGRSKLNRQLPSLLRFFEEHVVAELEKETTKAIERKNSALQ
ncbi:uncharacterized protein LOC124167087 [Ischnura elegans]|uniref:uncharacterized protein LOC124167087 n=1 Tax=Ischnura elegans TaxID=197161 RepID=UPI001ED8AB81|nr:uncharacterized protein LOC124167087 [Ischnura elegans]